MNCQHLVNYIIEACTDVNPHSCLDMKYFMEADEYETAKDEMFEILGSDDTLGFEDIYQFLKPYFPNLTRNDFIRIYLEYYNPESEESEGTWETGSIYNKV